MLDAGKSRADILAKTGSVLGAAGANLAVNEGEISVLMGLSGSGKSTLLRAVNGLNKVTRGEVLVQGRRRMVDVVILRRGDAAPCAPDARWPWCSSNLPCCRGARWPRMWASASNWPAFPMPSAR